MEIAIKTEDLRKIYKDKKRYITALRDLSLEVYGGEVFGFLGPNGAGKSTTIKLLMGLIFPTSGSFTIKGISGKDIRYRRFIGYLPENPSFYDYLTAGEFLRFVGRTFDMPENVIASETERLLKLLDLYDARNRAIRSYSKGMVQRLGLAQALLHDPEILILDEPMSGLDPIGRILVRDIILDLKKSGKCIFMSTHILNDIEAICDRVGIIVKGKLRLVESLDSIMTKGIKGYMMTFNFIDEATRNSVKLFGEEKELKKGFFSIFVRKENLQEVLSITGQGRASIQLIEPVRKGLEDLFAEIIEKYDER